MSPHREAFSRARWKRAVKNFWIGVVLGYPVCCYFRFALDDLINAASYRRRGITGREFVPCYRHQRRFGVRPPKGGPRDSW